MIIYEKKFTKINFLRAHSDNETFIGWICPLLKPLLIVKREFIYQEGDTVNNIFFLEAG
jgi:hypothetical protein